MNRLCVSTVANCSHSDSHMLGILVSIEYSRIFPGNLKKKNVTAASQILYLKTTQIKLRNCSINYWEIV